jgi:hypothetical protein
VSDKNLVDLEHQVQGALPRANAGVPAGGTLGQVLTKISGTDYDSGWGGAGGGSGTAFSVTEIALAPGAPGNFTVAHGLAAAPAFVLIQMSSGGSIWLQNPTAFDATNLYLVASDPGITGTAVCFAVAPSVIVPLAPSAPGDFSVPHGLGSSPALALVQMTSSGAVWFQPAQWDGTNIYLTASDAGITAKAIVWASVPALGPLNFNRVSLAPGSPGNFTVAHGLGQTPTLVLIRMTSNGVIWLQSPTGYDATNLYLVASDASITGEAECWNGNNPSATLVVGPASAVDSDFAQFDGTTGKLIKDGGLSLSIDGTFAANSDAKTPSQKAAKTYVDALATATAAALALKAPLASPVFTGTPTAPTPTTGDDSGKIATTAFVEDAIDNLTAADIPNIAESQVTGLVTDLAAKVVGPGSATDSDFVQFDGTTGKLVKDAGQSPATVLASAKAAIPGIIGITIDGGSSVISTGVKGYVQIPYGATIVGWSIMADQSGSISIDIDKHSSSAPPSAPTIPNTTTDKISASAPISLSSAQSGAVAAAGVSTWTTAVAQWDVIGFNVTSAATLTRVTILIEMTRS